MNKVQLFSSVEDMTIDQRREEMLMTPEQRWLIAFELIELANEISPDKKFAPESTDDIPWIELKFRDGVFKGNR